MQLVQLGKRQTTPPLPAQLNDAVGAALLADEPDLGALELRLCEELSLAPDESAAVLFRLVSGLNARFFPPVTHLELIHTEGCNLGCNYCFEKEMLGWRRMKPETARAAVDLLFEYSRGATHLTIVHFGGEPTLNLPGVKLVTEYAERRAAAEGKTLEFNMTSNGVLITEATAAYFAEHKIMVLLSVDGLEQSHDSYRRDKKGKGTFAKVRQTIDLLKRTQRWVGVKMTVMPENVHRLYDDVVGLYALGVNQFIIGYATGIEWPAESMQTYADELGRVYRWYKEEPRQDLRIADFDAPEEGAFFGCQAGKISVTVTVDGEVSPCSKVLALDNRKLLGRLGDVRHGLFQVKNRAELVSCSKLKKEVAARGLADEFQGGCFASNYEAHGDLYVPNQQDHLFSVLQRATCGGCASHR